MEDNSEIKFNVITLLKNGDFDLLTASQIAEALLVEDYFAALETLLDKILALEPEMSGDLLPSNSKSLVPKITEIKELSNQTQCGMLSSAATAVLGEISNGNNASARILWRKLSNIMNSVYARTMDAYLEDTTSKKVFEGYDPNDYRGMPLAKMLEKMGEQEDKRKMRVLAVDDMAIMLRSITSILSNHYEVFSLTKGAHLEPFLRQITPELFLLDIEMPDMRGYDLIPIIRSFPEHKDTPILILTGNPTRSNLKSAIEMGVADFIAKPVDGDILLEKVGTYIGKKKTFPKS